MLICFLLLLFGFHSPLLPAIPKMMLVRITVGITGWLKACISSYLAVLKTGHWTFNKEPFAMFSFLSLLPVKPSRVSP